MLDNLLARLTLEGVSLRMSERELAWDFATGTFEPPEGELAPRPKSVARREAWLRQLKQVQSQGPRVMSAKLNAALGDVSWGKPEAAGDEWRLDARLEALRIGALARECLKSYLVDGIAAVIAHRPEPEARTRITRLGGYLEPYFDRFDRDRITGLYQCWTVRERNRLTHTVRVYDFEDPEAAVIREWRQLPNPTALGRAPDAVTERAPVPRFVVYDRTHEGLVVSPMLQAVNLFRALLATELRLVAVEEFAVPMLKATGKWDKTGTGAYPELAPQSVWTGEAGAELEFLHLANHLAELRAQRDMRREELREFLGLPGGALGNDSPSGEAIREANIRMNQNADADAEAIASLLTEAVADLCAEEGLEPVPVSVTKNRAYDAPETMRSILEAQAAGLIPFEVAARELQPFFRTYSDAELRRFVAEQTARLTPQDLQSAFGLPRTEG